MIEYEFIGFPLFCIHIDLEFVLIHKAKKTKDLGQYSATHLDLTHGR